MANEQITTYLNDHLAGSVVALELLEKLGTLYSGMPLGLLLAELRDDVTADRNELEELMNRLQIAQSQTRKFTAWLAEKATELKLRLDDSNDGTLYLLETFEVLSLGIEGKKGMWLALAAAAENADELRAIDYNHLVQRAEQQRQKVEEVRLETAKKALLIS